MKDMRKKIRAFLADQSGATAIEYGLIAAGISVAIIAVVTGLLLLGTHESARVNTVLVVVKIATLSLFVAVTLPAFDASHLHPFMPYGFAATAGPDGVQRGVMAAA